MTVHLPGPDVPQKRRKQKSRQTPGKLGECQVGDIVQVEFGLSWVRVTGHMREVMRCRYLETLDNGEPSLLNDGTGPYIVPSSWRIADIHKLAPWRRAEAKRSR